MKIIKDIEQGSKEWHEKRRCRVTGTKLDDVMGTPLARLQLICELIAEEGTEQSKITRPTEEMERGTAEEIFAIKRYEQRFGIKTEKICMCISDEFDWLAYSPDAMILDEEGKYSVGIEVKNPDSKKVILYKIMNMVQGFEKKSFCGVPLDYKWQVINGFLVNEDLQKTIFIIHDARFIEDDAKLYTIEVYRDNPEVAKAMQEAREELVKFREDWMKYRDIVLPTSF